MSVYEGKYKMEYRVRDKLMQWKQWKTAYETIIIYKQEETQK